MNYFCIDLDEKQTEEFKQQAPDGANFLNVSHDDDLIELFNKNEGEHIVLVSDSNTEFINHWQSVLSSQFPQHKLEIISNELKLLDDLPGDIPDLSDESSDELSDGLSLSLDTPDIGGLDLSGDFTDNGQNEDDLTADDMGLDLGLDESMDDNLISLSSNDEPLDTGFSDDFSENSDEGDSGLDLSFEDTSELPSLDSGDFSLDDPPSEVMDESSEDEENSGLDLSFESPSDELVEESDELSLDDLTGDDLSLGEEENEERLEPSLSSDFSLDEDSELDDTSKDEDVDLSESEANVKPELSLDSIDNEELFGEMNDLTENDFSIDDIESSLVEKDTKASDLALDNNEDDSLDELDDLEVFDELDSVSHVSPAQVDSAGFEGKDLEGYSQTIRELREDRERLLSKVEELELHKDSTKKRHLSIEAMLEEKKIELDIAKKRSREEFEKMSRKLESLKANEGSIKDKNSELREQIEKLNKRTFLDMRKVQVREKELSSQLGLLRTDTENQIRNRDIIILDLKRKIDILEYDIEQSWKQEKAAKKEKLILQSKIDRLVGSLKDVVESLHEDDIDSWLNKIEKK